MSDNQEPQSKESSDRHDEPTLPTEATSRPDEIAPPLVGLIASIGAAVARDASAEARAAGATACRSILAVLEAKPGQPLAAFPTPAMPPATSEATSKVMKKAAAKHALTGLGRCAKCGGAIISQRVLTFGGGAERTMAYGCSRHRDRGSAVCPATVYQSKAEVEAALIDQLQTYVLADDALAMVLAQVRAEIEAQLPKRRDDIAALEADLANARAEQKRLAKAVALSDDVPELVVELQQRSARIQNLEAQLIAAKRTPADLAALVERVEANVRTNIAALRSALTEPSDLREVFHSMFPNGLTFEAARTPDGMRQIWRISGDADFAAILKGKRSDRGFECVATPTGFEPVLPA
jgi:hypothetical protein